MTWLRLAKPNLVPGASFIPLSDDWLLDTYQSCWNESEAIKKEQEETDEIIENLKARRSGL